MELRPGYACLADMLGVFVIVLVVPHPVLGTPQPQDPASTGDKPNQTRDENHPLLTVMSTEPHSMSLMVKPKDYKPGTMVRLLYERVPAHRQPIMQHLDDPVIEYVQLTRRVQSHDLTELPMGKYIVCGEAMLHGEVYQASCFETRIERLDNNSELCEGWI